MIPAPFDYRRAATPAEAMAMLGSDPDAKALAGGHSLLPLMRLRFARPSLLVDIGRLEGLSYVRREGDEIAIGALTRHHDLATSDVLLADCPIVAATASQIGDPQVRHVGTIGGSVAHADPASDLPTVLVALDATLSIAGPGGDRRVAARDFFRGLFTADLAQDELLTEVRVPVTRGRGWSYLKFRRRAQDWAVVGVAALVGDGAPSVALTNMADRPVRAAGVEESLSGGADPATAAERAAEGTAPPSDPFASAAYRSDVVRVIVRRALEEAVDRRG